MPASLFPSTDRPGRGSAFGLSAAIGRMRHPSALPILPPDLSEAAQWRLLDMIYADKIVLLANLALSLLVGGIAYAGLRTPLVALWSLAGIGLALSRLADGLGFERLRAANALAEARRRFATRAAAIAIYWGAASFVLELSDSPLLWLWVLNGQTGFLVFAVARNNPAAAVCYLQIVLTGIPLAFACLLSRHTVINIYASMTVLFFFACLATVRHLNNRTLHLIRTDEENARLLRQISDANIRLESANRQLQMVAATDALTGIPNRLSFDLALGRAWAGALRDGGAIGLILIDIDHFKPFNDRFGHQAGDACLRRVAQTIAANALRPGDLAARYGGEEFAVIIANADPFGLIDTAERMRAAIEALDIPAALGGGPVTVSAGAALCAPSVPLQAPARAPAENAFAELIATADRKLYEAKAAGRNRVRTATVEGVICNKPPA